MAFTLRSPVDGVRPSSPITYRPEIDGLRAVAVVAVLVFHAEFALFGGMALTGGFLGVDVFFVISGYLIAGILMRELRGGRFSLARFYERRARRILPALVTVILVSLPVAWHVMLPKALKEFAWSAVGALSFVANIVFWRQDGYGAEPSRFKPLLHTWSLGVEEQFYILFPIALFLLWRVARRRLPLVFALGIAGSLLLAEWAARAHPDAAFYLLPTRAWELLAGALLACLPAPGPAARRARLWLPALGLVLAAAPMILYDEGVPHPGLATTPVILGTALLIHFARGGDPVSRLLASRPFVGVGLISYSLYLWHLPILVFARIASETPLTNLSKLGLLALSVALAAASWRYVEQPFRRRNVIGLRGLLAATGGATAAAAAVALAFALNDGFPRRFPPIISDMYLQAALRLPSDGKGMCMRPGVADGDYCVFGDPDAPVTYYAVGDSHVQRFIIPLIPRLAERNARLASLNVGACMYGLELESAKNGREPTDCEGRVNRFRRQLLLEAPPSVVIYGGRFPWYLTGNRKPGEAETLRTASTGVYFLLRLVGEAEQSDRERRRTVAENVRAGIRELLDHGHKVVLIYPAPETSETPARYLQNRMPKGAEAARAWLEDRSNWLTVPYGEFREHVRESYGIYDSLGLHPGLMRIHPENILCNTTISGACLTHDADTLYYEDNDHLSVAGNARLLRIIFDRMDRRWPAISG